MPFDSMNFDFGTKVRTKQEEKALVLLRKARIGLAQPKAWCKGQLHKHTMVGDAHCVLGWLVVANGKPGWWNANNEDKATVGIDRLASKYLEPFIPDRYLPGSIVAFNDHPDTKKRDVLRVFDRAIKSLEAKA